MMFLLAFLGLITLLAVVLQKTYRHIPPRELKRRARTGDQMAAVLYRAAAYGPGLDVVLWLLIGLSAAGFMLVAASVAPPWLAFVASSSMLWVSLAWLPRSQAKEISLQITRVLTPAVVWLVRLLHPLVERVMAIIRRHRPVTIHTGLFEKEDLVELLEDQKVAAHNRIDQTELDIARHALTFGDRLVREVMTPRKVAKFVKASDSVGPVLLDELHKSGFSRFPVTGEKAEEIVGTLYMHDLVGKDASGPVKNFMSSRVYYVQEEQSLWHALNAFLKTKHHLFVAVNSFEEIVGVISIEDILEEILGKEIVDEFDRYDDLRAVAQLQALAERQKHKGASVEKEEKENEQEVVE